MRITVQFKQTTSNIRNSLTLNNLRRINEITVNLMVHTGGLFQVLWSAGAISSRVMIGQQTSR